MNNLLPNVEFVVVKPAVSAGQTEVATDAIDMANWTGVVFAAMLGTVSSGAKLGFAADHSENDSSDFAELEGSLEFTAGSGDADNKLMILDVVRPEKRYVRARLTRATANAAVNGIIAIKYQGARAPVVPGDTVLASAVLPNPKAAS